MIVKLFGEETKKIVVKDLEDFEREQKEQKKILLPCFLFWIIKDE